MNNNIAFIGVGNMASAILKGMTGEEKVTLYDKDPSKYDLFEGRGYNVAKSPEEAVLCADYIILAVKPQNFDELLSGLAKAKIDTEGKTFISIAAGIPISRITSALGEKTACIRTMPNTPLMVGKGVTALTKNSYVKEECFRFACDLFGRLGAITVIEEKDMNAIISATSSSPAYVYLFIKAICDSAYAQGLKIDNMTELVANMVIGSAEMVLKSGKTPDELIRMVTSPNGTTERAMNILYQSDFSGIIDRAMKDCTKRAIELSRN